MRILSLRLIPVSAIIDNTPIQVLSMLRHSPRSTVRSLIFSGSALTKLRILNAGGNRQLLKGLGVEKLFKFEDAEFEPYSIVIYPAAQADDKSMKTAAETVLQAHQTLMDADDSNKARFGAVVEMTQQDLDRMKKD